jgi:hypothetical protein
LNEKSLGFSGAFLLSGSWQTTLKPDAEILYSSRIQFNSFDLLEYQNQANFIQAL